MARKVDFDRGVLIKRHDETGMYIVMYVDDPGVYLDMHGNKVSDRLAQMAGFDVGRHVRERNRKDRVAEFMRKVDQELELAQTDENKRVLAERGDFRVIELPGDQANVEDLEGNRLNPMPLSQTLAMQMLDNLVPETTGKGKVVKENGGSTA